MKQNRSAILSKFELEIMHVFWDRGKATVQEVKDALSEAHPGAYSTFLTMMRRMEKKGILEHEVAEDGRTYIYRPLVNREEASSRILQDVYHWLFRGSSERLLDGINTFFLKEGITSEQIQRLKKLIIEKGEQDE